MKTLTIVLLLGQLALARPVLDLSALDRPGLTPAQRVQLLDQAFQKFPDPVSRLEIDCLRAEELSVHPQVVPYARQQIEKYTQWYGAPKFASVPELVAEVLRRHELARLKVRLVQPDIAPITLTLE